MSKNDKTTNNSFENFERVYEEKFSSVVRFA